jgi:pseudouridine kinase
VNEKERQVLQLIRENPYYSQQEMAQILNISRPALANIISTLIRRGEIIGRGYVLREQNEILVIGGANVDRKFHITEQAQLATSNPATVSYSVGGVARNIAENLGRLRHEVQLVTVLGQDHDAELILSESSKYMKFSYSEKLHNESTGSYTAVLNHNGELIIALANMSIYDQLVPTILEKNEVSYQKAKLIIMDLNCPKETVNYFKSIAQQFSIPFALVPVSSPKMKHMPDELLGVTYFICNKDEAETYLNLMIQSEEDYTLACQKLIELGAEHVIITRGSKGIASATQTKYSSYEAFPVEKVLDVTGAGDAFVSGFLHGTLTEHSFELSIQLGLVNASRTLQSDKTVRMELTPEELINWREQ